MKLMSLSPDNERVRGAARAHAAGEMDQKEYRRIRRQAIVRLLDGSNSEPTPTSMSSLDDTQRRWISGEVGVPLAPPRRRIWMALMTLVLLVAVGMVTL